jgi:alanyl-tRNA synthetase
MRMIIRRMYYNLMLVKDLSVEEVNILVLEAPGLFGQEKLLAKPQVIIDEIQGFRKTIANGLKILEQMLTKGADRLLGKDIFMLYDSYGFPLELTREIAKEKDIVLDEQGFMLALEEAREKSRQGTKDMFKKGVDRSKYLDGVQATKFI